MKVFIAWRDFYNRWNISYVSIWVYLYFAIQQLLGRIYNEIQDVQLVRKKDIIFEGGKEQAKQFRTIL